MKVVIKNKMNRLEIKLRCMLFTGICFLFFHIHAAAQINYHKEFQRLSCPEKRWVIFHPFIARKSFRLTLEAREAAREMLKDSLLDKNTNGGQNDAFRHAYWMALLSQHICWRKAIRLGKAHEKGDYIRFKKGIAEEGALPDSASGAMDLFNNTVGAEIGRSNKKIPADELKIMVRDAVLAGKMKVISEDLKGEALDCDGNVIDLSQYQHQWNIPKCLVSSDHGRK